MDQNTALVIVGLAVVGAMFLGAIPGLILCWIGRLCRQQHLDDQESNQTERQ